MTTETAIENDTPSQSASVNEETKPKYSGELRKRYVRVLPHVRRALHEVTDPKERRIKRNAAFVAADSLMEEIIPIIEAYKKDPLTKLNTRQTFEELLLLECEKAKLSNGNLRLLFIDLNGFKPVNDTLGHDFGDEVLKQIGKVISKSIRPDDIAGRIDTEKQEEKPDKGYTGRFGGDEFVILLPNTNAKGAEAVSKRLAERVANIPFHEILAQNGLDVTMSIGDTDVNLDNPLSSLRSADQAMYEQKKGRSS